MNSRSLARRCADTAACTGPSLIESFLVVLRTKVESASSPISGKSGPSARRPLYLSAMLVLLISIVLGMWIPSARAGAPRLKLFSLKKGVSNVRGADRGRGHSSLGRSLSMTRKKGKARKRIPLLRTNLFMASTSGPISETTNFVKSSDVILDWNARDRRWAFLCESKALAGAKYIVWQVSLFPFKPGPNPMRPPGLVKSKRLSDKSGSFCIDFAAFAPRPSMLAGQLLDRKALVSFRRSLLPGRGKSRTASLIAGRLGACLRTNPGITKPLLKDRNKKGRTRISFSRKRTHGMARLRQVAAPRGRDCLPFRRRHYYVRVLLINGRGGLAAAPSNQVVVTYGQPKKGGSFHFADIPTYPVNNPSMNILSYRPIRPAKYDSQYRFVVWKKPRGLFENAFQVGQKLYLNPFRKNRHKSFWDKLGDALSAFIDFVASAVNWASATYARIKHKVAALVASCIPLVDADFVEGLIDAGLVSLGIPPSLPNFDQLVDMGAEYLARELVAQSPVPVPDSVADKAMKELAHAALDEARKVAGRHGMPDFIRLDPDAQRREAFFRLKVSNDGKDPTFPISIDVSDSLRVFARKSVSVPALDPGESITIPVFLTPNDTSHNFLSRGRLSAAEWRKRYERGTTTFRFEQSFAVPPEYLAATLGLNYRKYPFELGFKHDRAVVLRHEPDKAYR